MVTASDKKVSIDRIAVAWGPNQAPCFLSLYCGSETLAVIQIHGDDTFEGPHLGHSLAALSNRTDVTLIELQELLPKNEMMSWEDAVIVDLGAIEVRGKGAGFLFWMSTPNPASVDPPTPDQTAEAHAVLTAVRDMVWPSA